MLIEMGKKIQEERNKLGLSVEQFAEKMQTTEIAVKLWERGKMAPRISRLIMMSQLFNVSVDYLIGIKESKQ